MNWFKAGSSGHPLFLHVGLVFTAPQLGCIPATVIREHLWLKAWVPQSIPKGRTVQVFFSKCYCVFSVINCSYKEDYNFCVWLFSICEVCLEIFNLAEVAFL